MNLKENKEQNYASIQRLFKVLAITGLIIFGPYGVGVLGKNFITYPEPIPNIVIWLTGILILILTALCLSTMIFTVIPAIISIYRYIKTGKWKWFT